MTDHTDEEEAEHTQAIAIEILQEMSNHDARLAVNAVAVALCVLVKTLNCEEVDALAAVKFHWDKVDVDITDVPPTGETN